ncbi:hypothetical protein [Rhizobium halophytocola]|uniref:Phage tail protein n=1 Tax=Rhizobium halophytocola TaxID=735519 RepID=A0ABS4E2G2_9HYPH|nr:hypothetical protein [Rhizobium halophytocola]MBP1852123.1 hypothetical protein [Rhizobium halophytocola]
MPVASRIQDIRDRLVSDVDARFAETVRLSFLKNGVVDPSRPAMDIEAVLRVGAAKETNISGGDALSWNARLVAGKAQLHIDVARYEGPSFRQGDTVRALARTGQPWFEVLRIDDRGESRLILELGEK